MSMLQERIEELNSAILNICEDKIKITGFISVERLLDYCRTCQDCRYSLGVYPLEEFDIAYIKDSALFIILSNDIEIARYQFNLLKSDTIKYKGEDKKTKSKVYSIRYCYNSRKYNYKDMDKSLLFNSEMEIKKYFQEIYNTDLILET